MEQRVVILSSNSIKKNKKCCYCANCVEKIPQSVNIDICSTVCGGCGYKYNKIYYYKNISKELSRKKKYREENRSKIRQKDKVYSKMYREKHISDRKAYNKKYYAENILKELKRKSIYRHTIKGKESMRRSIYKRRRLLGFDPLNSYFSGADFHHLHIATDLISTNHNLGVYIPKDIHKNTVHNSSTGYNMCEINRMSLEWVLENCVFDVRVWKLYLYYCTLTV